MGFTDGLGIFDRGGGGDENPPSSLLRIAEVGKTVLNALATGLSLKTVERITQNPPKQFMPE